LQTKMISPSINMSEIPPQNSYLTNYNQKNWNIFIILFFNMKEQCLCNFIIQWWWMILKNSKK
jgi:hypothetical protein